MSKSSKPERHEFKSSGRHRQWCADCPPHDQQPRSAEVHAVECDIFETVSEKGCRVHRYVPCPTLDAEGFRLLSTEVHAVEPRPCPEDCMMCSGEACELCGAGCWSHVEGCTHDVMERHTVRNVAIHQVEPKSETVNQLPKRGIYVASRASVPERGQMWRKFRAEGVAITSTWIDENGEGESVNLSELWKRITDEIRNSNAVVLYAEASDFPLKGALIEAGIALGMGKVVIVCLPYVTLEERSCRPIGSWIKHPLVIRENNIREAIRMAQVVRADESLRAKADAGLDRAIKIVKSFEQQVYAGQCGVPQIIATLNNAKEGE